MCRKRSRVMFDTSQNRKRRERLRLLRFQPPVPDFAQAPFVTVDSIVGLDKVCYNCTSCISTIL